MRKLILTAGSPFARTVRIVLDAQGPDGERQDDASSLREGGAQ